MGLVGGAILHAALFGIVAVVSGFELGKLTDSGFKARNYAVFALIVYTPLLTFVALTALMLRRWARRGRPELVALELVFLLLGFLFTALVVGISSMK